MKLSRFAVPAAAALLVFACAKNDKAAADSAAAAQQSTPTPPPAPPPFSLASAAGKWQMTSTPMAGADTTSTKYTMTATGDTTGWSITFPSGMKVPLHVTVSGDSILLKT